MAKDSDSSWTCAPRERASSVALGQLLIPDPVYDPAVKGHAIDRFCEATVVDQSGEVAFPQSWRQRGGYLRRLLIALP